MELEAQRKNEEMKGRRNKWRTKETRDAGDGKEILFEEALLVFEAQDPNIDCYMKVAAVVQNSIQC